MGIKKVTLGRIFVPATALLSLTVVLEGCGGTPSVHGTSSAACGPAADGSAGGLQNPAIAVTSASLAVSGSEVIVTFHGSGPYQNLIAPGQNAINSTGRNLPTADDTWTVYFSFPSSSASDVSATLDGVPGGSDYQYLGDGLYFDPSVGPNGSNGEGLQVSERVSGNDLSLRIENLGSVAQSSLGRFAWYATTDESGAGSAGGSYSCPSGYDPSSTSVSETVFPGNSTTTEAQTPAN